MKPEQVWLEARSYSDEQLDTARDILVDVRAGMTVSKAVRHHPLPSGGYVAKHILIHAYRELTDEGDWPFEAEMIERLRMKPIRTLSGVTTVTVLTKPFPCPETDVEFPIPPGAAPRAHHLDAAINFFAGRQDPAGE